MQPDLPHERPTVRLCELCKGCSGHPVALADNGVDDRRGSEREEAVEGTLNLFPEITQPEA